MRLPEIKNKWTAIPCVVGMLMFGAPAIVQFWILIFLGGNPDWGVRAFFALMIATLFGCGLGVSQI